MSKRLVLVCCGCSAALSFMSILALIKDRLDCPLDVVLTKSARAFVEPRVVGLVADTVYDPSEPVNPTGIAEQASLVAVYPASANFVACAAIGLASTPALGVYRAFKGRKLVFPHTGRGLWDAPRREEQVAALRSMGDVIVDPVRDEGFQLWKKDRGVGYGSPPQARVVEIIEIHLPREGQSFGSRDAHTLPA